jgi:hypothetical protein
MDVYKLQDAKCYVLVGSRKKKSCRYRGTDVILLEKAFSQHSYNGYYGEIEVVFDAYNPRTNKDLGLSIKVELYLDNSFLYKMAEIQGGVEPVFDCNFPCASCSPFDMSDCESCSTGQFERYKYLQKDRETGIKTCKA